MVNARRQNSQRAICKSIRDGLPDETQAQLDATMIIIMWTKNASMSSLLTLSWQISVKENLEVTSQALGSYDLSPEEMFHNFVDKRKFICGEIHRFDVFG